MLYNYNNIITKKEPINKELIYEAFDKVQRQDGTSGEEFCSKIISQKISRILTRNFPQIECSCNAESDNLHPNSGCMTESSCLFRSSSSNPYGDVLVIENFLTENECDALVRITEEIGYTFWRSNIDEGESLVAKDSVEDQVNSGKECPHHPLRTADTIEVNLPQLADRLSERLSLSIGKFPSHHFSKTMPGSDELYENDLDGLWEPDKLSSSLLFAKYGPGCHFSPHADGASVIDVNHRTMYTLLIYLNDCLEGGETHFFYGMQCDVLSQNPETGLLEGKESHRTGSVAPKKGSAAIFYYPVMHEGAAVGKQPGSIKYILRTDLIYKRTPPILTEPNDQKAYELFCEARKLELCNEGLKAVELLRLARRLSPKLAELYQFY